MKRVQHEKSETWKKCSTMEKWKVKQTAKTEMSSIRKKCNIGRVQHEESATRKKFTLEIMKHEKCTIQKKWSLLNCVPYVLTC